MKPLLLPSILLMASLSYGQMPCNGEFLLSGTATQQDNCIQLTANTSFQQGCAWLNTPVDFSQPFTHDMLANFGAVDGSGADGICLIYQTGGPSICGNPGGGIGAEGINNSFIVEFDTWDNGAIQSDIAPDHCAVAINGDLNNQINGPVVLPNVEDGQNHTITFQWNPNGNLYTIILDGNTVISGSFDIINQCFQGNTIAYWGYSASTGSAFNAQSVCPVLPPPIPTDAGSDISIPCISAQVTLNGTATTSGPYNYSWSSPNGGIILSGGNTLTPAVQGPGTYVLTLSDPIDGCMETDEVVVTFNPIRIDIDAPVFAPCAGGQVTLDGSGSSFGSFITYHWSTQNGQLLSDPNLPTVQAGAPGTYTLTVTYDDGDVTCSRTTSTTLQPHNSSAITVEEAGEVGCNNATVPLSPPNAFIGPQFSYQWTTEDGTVLSPDQFSVPFVDEPGEYTLTVLDNNTNCTSNITLVVGEDGSPPIAVANALSQLDCHTEVITLSGNGSDTGPQIRYTWTTQNGNIVSGGNTLNAVVDAPGLYMLRVVNEATGCENSASVNVGGSPPRPEVTIAPPDTLNCATEIAMLYGSVLGQPDDFSYAWSTGDGLLLSGQNELVSSAGEPGTYYLSVTETATNCTTVDTVVVMQQISTPIAYAGSDQTLDCGATSVTLDGTATGLLPGYTAMWSSPDGNILSGANTLSPSVAGSGSYILTVVDTFTRCIGTDTVLVANSGSVPIADISLPDTLDCVTQSVTLIGSGTTAGDSSGLTVRWSSTGGHPITNAGQLMATVTEPGVYTLEVTDTLSGCSALDSVEVFQDTLSPVASILPSDTLTCFRTTLLLDATASSSGSHFNVEWSTDEGGFITGSETLSPVINKAGTYALEVRNTRNQCISTASISVVQDTAAPAINILPPDTLTCTVQAVNLSAHSTSSSPNLAYDWTTADGIIQNGAQSLSPEVIASGTYTLEATDNQNGCSSTATAFVPVDTLSPIAATGPDDTLNCSQPALQLGSSNTSTGSRYAHTWSGNSPITGNTTAPTLTADTPGTYQLIVTDTINGCQAFDTVTLTGDFSTPVATIATPDTLNCLDSLVTLNGGGSSTNGNFRYEWKALVSGISFVSVAPVAEVTAAGTYTLEVENLDNGCTATDTVAVFQDTVLPFAGIEQADTLTCTREQVTLQATAGSSNGNPDISWSAAGGNFLSGQNTLQPVVDAPGIYQLRVTDPVNNCSVNTSVTIDIDTLPPAISLSPAGILNCRDTLLSLSGATPSPLAMWSWSTSDGHLFSGSDTASPTVDEPGTYEATVFSPANGCTSTVSQTILQDIAIPAVTIAAPAVLTCTQPSVLLSGAASDQAPGWDISWQAPNGSTISDTLLAEVEIPGTYSLEIINTENFCRNIDTITVLQDTLHPAVSLIPADTLDCGTDTVTLTGNAGEVFDPVYAWTSNNGQVLSGSNSPAAVTAVPGDYYFTVTNQTNGCQTTDSLRVVQDTISPVLANISPPSVTCSQPTVWLDATPASNTGWAYTWTIVNQGSILNVSDSSAVEVASDGFYRVSATNLQNNCTASRLYTVGIDTLAPTVTLQTADTLNCSVNSVTLTGESSHTGPDFSLSWSTVNGTLISPTNQSEATATAPGTYTLSVQNNTNGCSSSQSVEVVQDTIAPVVHIALPDTLNCDTERVTLDASGSGALGDFTFNWNTLNGLLLSGTNGPQPEAGAPGQYTVVVTDLQNFCSASDSVTIPVDTLSPLITLAPPAILNCEQNSVPLSAEIGSAGPDYELTWIGPEAGIISGQDGLSPVVAQPGVYSLLVTNPNNGCTSMEGVTVMQDIMPPTASAGTDFFIPCFPEPRQLDGISSSTGPAFSYSWSSNEGTLLDGGNTLSPTIDAPGTYILLVRNAENGCTAADSVEVSQDIPRANSTTVQPLCFGDMGQIGFVDITGGAPPYVYSIDGGEAFQNNPDFESLTPDTYNLVVQDANGCEASLTTTIVQPDSLVLRLSPETAEINYGESQAIQLQSNYPLEELTDITWSPNPGLNCYDCLSPIASPGLSTVYQVTATNANGCQDQASIRIIVKKDIPVYIPTAFSPNGDGNNDWFTVYAGEGIVTNIRSMQIFNRWGEQVFQNQNFPPGVPTEGWDGRFRNQYLSPGVFAYVVEVEYFDGTTDLLKGDVTLAR